MDAALNTRKLGIDFLSMQVKQKDVRGMQGDDFRNKLKDLLKTSEKKDVLKKDDIMKNKEVIESEESTENNGVQESTEPELNKDTEKTENTQERVNTQETENIQEDEKAKDEKKAKKKDKNEIIQDVESKVEKLQERLDKLLEKMNISETDVENEKDVGEDVDNVGPQLVETETITLNLKEKSEKKDDSKITKDFKKNLENEEDTNINKDEVENNGIGLNKNSSYEFSKSTDDKNKDDNKEDKIKVFNFKSKNTSEKTQLDNSEVDLLKAQEDSLSIEDGKENISSIVDNKERIDVLEQISEKIDVSLFDDKSEMIIKLKPDNLGKLTVQISVEKGVITAKFLAESEKVKEIIESSFQELKDSLQEQGMNIQNLSVSVGNQRNGELVYEQQKRRLFNNKEERIEDIGYKKEQYYDVEINRDVVKNYWPDSTVIFSA